MFERIKRRVMYSRPFRMFLGWMQRIVPPGFDGSSLYEISRFFFRALFDGQLTTRAAAIAFKLFLAFFPAVIVLLTLIPFIPIADFQDQLLDTFEKMMPGEVFHFIEDTLEDLVVKKHGALLSISFIIGLFLASNSINAILEGFSESANLTTWHTALKQRLLSLGLLLALTVLSVLTVPILTVSGIIIRTLNEEGIVIGQLQVLALFAAKWAISIMLVIIAVSLLYNVGDPSSKRYKVFTPGSFLAVFLILLVSQALAFIFNNITDYNALYGSIGAILAVQLWIYANMIVLLIGYELNMSIARARHLRTERLDLMATK